MIKKINYNSCIEYFLYLLIGIIIFIPILDIRMPRIGIGIVKDLLTLIILIISSFQIAKNKKIYITKGSIIILVYAIYGFAHIFISKLSISIGLDKFRLMYLYPITFTILIMSNYKISLKFFENIKKIIIIQGIIIIFIAVLELIFKEKLLTLLYGDYYNKMHVNLFGTSGARTVSILVNPIILGLFLNLLLTVLFTTKTNNKFIKALILLMIPLCIIITFTTLSRISYIAMFVIIIYFFIVNKISPQKLILCIVSISIIIPMTTHSLSEDSLIIRRMNQLGEDDIKGNVRFENWSKYIDMAWDKDPYMAIWGSGLGSSNSSNENQSEIMKKAENSYISMLGELGFIGFIIMILLFIRYIYNCFMIKRINKNIANLLLGWMIILSIGSLTNDMFHNNPFSLYFWLFFLVEEIIINYRIKL